MLQGPEWGRGGPSHVFSCFVSSVEHRGSGNSPRPLKPHSRELTEIRNRVAATSLSGYPNWSTQPSQWHVPDDPSGRLAIARDYSRGAGFVGAGPSNSR